MSNVLFSFKTILKQNPFFPEWVRKLCLHPLSLKKDDLLEVFISQSLKCTAFFFSVALPSAWSTVLYTNTELFCFTGSHLAKSHKQSLMQFLSAFAPPSFDVHTLRAQHGHSLKNGGLYFTNGSQRKSSLWHKHSRRHLFCCERISTRRSI